MAKITKKDKEQVEEVMMLEPTIEETVEIEELVPLEEVQIEASTTTTKQEKLVRVRVKEKFKCYIGEWYYFEKNKVYSVPEHVKRTLMQRDKLLPM